MTKGFVLIVDEDAKVTLRFVGFAGEEGHKASHALREAVAKRGVKTSIEATLAPLTSDETRQEARA